MLLTQLIDQPFGLTNSQKTLKRQKRKSNVERTSTEEHTRISPERFLGQHWPVAFRITKLSAKSVHESGAVDCLGA
jgi:hypothetical protein